MKAFNCPKNASECNTEHWELNANLTDGNGVGIKSISLRVGDGELSYTSLSSPVVQARYNATCCIQTVEFVAEDKLGNEGKCSYTVVSLSKFSAIYTPTVGQIFNNDQLKYPTSSPRLKMNLHQFLKFKVSRLLNAPKTWISVKIISGS